VIWLIARRRFSAGARINRIPISWLAAARKRRRPRNPEIWPVLPANWVRLRQCVQHNPNGFYFPDWMLKVERFLVIEEWVAGDS